MIIYPAIDLYEGKAVRLLRGDYAQMTVYNDNPAAVAKGFKDAGATHLHVVDLEGARDGKPENFDTIERVVAESGLNVQVGGGIRDAGTIEKYFNIGVKRVILGTAAVSKPGFLKEMVEKFDEAIVVSADIKDGLIALKGWTEVSNQNSMVFCAAAEKIGVKTLVCTDISKDGLLGGPNMELYATLRKKLNLHIIASGGVTTIDEIKILAQKGIDGAIIGKTLYEGKIDLSEAIAAAK